MMKYLMPERAMIAVGAIAATCWWLDRADTVYVSSSLLWGFAIVTSLAQLAIGLIVTFSDDRERYLNVARYYQIALILGSFVVSQAVMASVVTAYSILLGAALLTLLWGTPGKARTIVGYVALAAFTALLVIGTTRRL